MNGHRRTDPEPDAPPQATGANLLLASAEGRILAAGLALAGLLLLGFGIGWTLFPDRILQYAAMTGLNLLIGPGAGMSFGYASGMTHLQVVPLNMLVETLHVLVFYPLFVLGWRHLLDLPALKSFVARMHEAAELRGGLVRKFGIAGLIVFVFVPFWMTGPVVGAIIGFLIGLRPWVTLAIVLPTTYVAIGLWALLLNELSAWAATFDRLAPWALLLAIVLIAAAGHLLHRRRNNRAAGATRHN
ncbi:MAG: small multi-drug export protein [Betaproteobacteria bacterium]|nr:small multi-drug export protein [Betaproteobacteria bacterium]